MVGYDQILYISETFKLPHWFRETYRRVVQATKQQSFMYIFVENQG